MDAIIQPFCKACNYPHFSSSPPLPSPPLPSPLQTILFTTDEDILQLVAENDDAFHGEVACFHGNTAAEEVELQRPRTADTEEEVRTSGRGIGVSVAVIFSVVRVASSRLRESVPTLPRLSVCRCHVM